MEMRRGGQGKAHRCIVAQSGRPGHQAVVDTDKRGAYRSYEHVAYVAWAARPRDQHPARWPSKRSQPPTHRPSGNRRHL